jgi:hypothetical protein
MKTFLEWKSSQVFSWEAIRERLTKEKREVKKEERERERPIKHYSSGIEDSQPRLEKCAKFQDHLLHEIDGMSKASNILKGDFCNW